MANIALQEIPENAVLQDLSEVVGMCAIPLGVELGLRMGAIKKILLMYPKNMTQQTLGVMKQWKGSDEFNPTILTLITAFQLADTKGVDFLRKKYR